MEIETYVYKDTCPWIFIEASFMTAKNWKQTKCLSTELIGKWNFSNSEIPLSHLKRTELSTPANNKAKFNSTIVSERSQTQEQHYLCPFTWTSRTGRGLPGGSVQETQEMWVPTLGWEDPLEEEMATHSSILAWKILQTEDIGGLQSIGSQRAGHNWAHMSP